MSKIYLYIFLQVVFQLVLAQNMEKKNYETSLDSLWSNNIIVKSLTPKGDWAIIEESYKNKNKLFLANMYSGELSELEQSNQIRFSNLGKWIASLNDDVLTLVNLENNAKQYFEKVSYYEFSFDDSFLIMKNSPENKLGDIKILNLIQNDQKLIKKVFQSILNPVSNKFLTVEKDINNSRNTVQLHDLTKNSLETIYNSDNDLFIKWNDYGNMFIVMTENETNQSLILFNLDGSSNYLYLKDIQKNIQVKKFIFNDLDISKEGDIVIIKCEKENSKQDSIKNKNIQIFNTNDKYLLPRMESLRQTDLNYEKIAWYPYKKEILKLSDDKNPIIRGLTSASKVFSFNPLKYEPLYYIDSYIDVYLIDLISKSKDLVVEKLYLKQPYLSISPSGRYVMYFLNDHWHLYDSTNKTTKNLTQNRKYEFGHNQNHMETLKIPYGCAGWTENEKQVILYDEFDIWLFDPLSEEVRKITNGRDKSISYRINDSKNAYNHQKSFIKFNLIQTEYNFNLPILLDMKGCDHKSGIALWKKDMSVNTIIYSDYFINGIYPSEDMKKLVFSKSKINTPHSLHIIDLESFEDHRILQSNEKILEYDLGKYEFINYTDQFGNELKATLIYPSNYDPNKNYPLITYIYEKNSKLINYFEPPSKYSYIGFNILNYVLNDYFILLPDIEYQIGQPGFSAFHCVIKAVKATLQNKSIDKDSIGLIGHSFGGYEAAFIATQTDIFKAIVAGAGVMDLTSFYHDISWDWGDAQAFRLENQQFRMGDSFYNLKDYYYQNSPLYHVENLKTPLLLWTGKNDYNINAYQSVLMYSAMRRLNKEGKLLLFDDVHMLLNKENQAFLSSEIMTWFNRYLKNKG